jgi:splicing factor 45
MISKFFVLCFFTTSQGDEAWKRRKQLTTAIFGEQPNTPQTDLSTNQPIKKGRGFAEKMLEKMGWKHGEGLGKEKQGIVAPLVARKTDKHSGVIIQGNAVLKSSSLPPPSTVSVPSYSMDQVSRIVLLTVRL